MCSVFVFIASTHNHGQFDTGLTTDLVHEIWQRREESAARPHANICNKLVWFKAFETKEEAEEECARMARWPLAWQTRLIETENASYSDLWSTLSAQPVINVSPHFNADKAEATAPYPVIRIAGDAGAPAPQAALGAPILIRRRAS